MNLKLNFAIFVSCFVFGCGSLRTAGPSAIVESPEVALTEDHGVSGLARTEPTQEFLLVDDASERPLVIRNPPDLDNSGGIVFGPRVVVAPRFQLGGALSPLILDFSRGFILDGRLMARYQFYGKTYAKDPSPGWLAGVFSHVNYGHNKTHGDQDGTFGPGGYPWRARATFRGFDLGLSVGYRWSRSALVYVGVANELYDVQGKVEQDTSDNGTYPAMTATLPRQGGRSTSVALGFSFGKTTRFDVVFSHSHNTWGSFDEYQNFVSVGLDIMPSPKESEPAPVN